VATAAARSFGLTAAHRRIGISYKLRRPVSEVIAERTWPTVLLLGLSTVLSTGIGLFIGIRGRGGGGARSTGVAGPVRHARVLARHPAADRLRGRDRAGGQRQRVVIAGALVLEPSMLVADEPVSSPDASVRGEILALLLGLVGDLGLSMPGSPTTSAWPGTSPTGSPSCTSAGSSSRDRPRRSSPPRCTPTPARC
jgi:hypothetical protein